MQLAAPPTSTVWLYLIGLPMSSVSSSASLAVLLHQVRKLDQHTLALRRRLARPAAVFKRRARRCDSDIHVGAIAARHHAQLAPIDGRQIFELLSGFAHTRSPPMKARPSACTAAAFHAMSSSFSLQPAALFDIGVGQVEAMAYQRQHFVDLRRGQTSGGAMIMRSPTARMIMPLLNI
jgi:hypothetical protein